MLNIGDVTFGLEAHTGGLDRAMHKLRQFEGAVDRVARSQADGANKTARAMLSQERAIKTAYQQTLNLQQALQRLNADPAALNSTTAAFQRLTNAMATGQLTTVQFARAQDAFRASVGQTQRHIRDLGRRAKQGAGDTHKFSEVLRNLQSASVLAVGPLSGIGARITAIGSIATRSTGPMLALVAGVTAFTVSAIGASVAAVKARMEFDRIDSTLRIATGSATGAAVEFDYVTRISRQLGTQLDITAKSYGKLSAAAANSNMTIGEVRELFEGVSTAAAAMKLSTEQTEGAFRAFEQMLSKGTVQAEELRGQLAERIPGAFGLAAKAMGVTTQRLNEMLENGEVLAEDLLPKLAKVLKDTFGDEAARSADRLQGNINKLKTAFFQLSMQIDKTFGISKLWNDIIKGTTILVDDLTTALNRLANAGPKSAQKGLEQTQNILRQLKELDGQGPIQKDFALKELDAAKAKYQELAKELTKLSIQKKHGIEGFWDKLTGKDVDKDMARITIQMDRWKHVIQELLNAYHSAGEGNRGKDPFGPFRSEAITGALADIENLRMEADLLAQGFDKAFVARKLQVKEFSDELRKAGENTTVVANMTKSYEAALIDIETAHKRIETAAAFKKAQEEVASVKYEADLLAKGFDKAFISRSQQIREMTAELLSSGIAMAEVTRLTTELEAALISIEQSAKRAEISKAIKETTSSIEKLERETALVAAGFDETFVKRRVHVQEMAESLLAMGVAMEDVQRLVTRWEEADDASTRLNARLEAQKKIFDELGEIGTSAMDSILDGIFDVMDGTKSMGELFSDVISNMLQDVTRFFANSFMNEQFGGSGNFFGQLFSGMMGASAGQSAGEQALVAAATGRRAKGGPVQGGKTYWVGERGPELFTAPSNGMIAPHSQPQVNVIIINNTEAQVSQKETRSGDQINMEIMIDNVTAKNLANPASRTNKALRGTMSKAPKIR